MTPGNRHGLVALLVGSVVGFLAISLDVTQHGWLERHDARIGLWVAGHTPHWLERASAAITTLGSAWSLAALTVLGVALLLRRGRRADAALLVAAVLLVSLATRGLKVAFGRSRPRLGDLTPVSHTLSYPSGHTSGSVVVFVLLAVLLAAGRRWWVVAGAALLAGLVGVTRVVVEAHWTTDVLAGYLLGTAIVAGVLLGRDALPGRSGGDCDRPGDVMGRV